MYWTLQTGNRRRRHPQLLTTRCWRREKVLSTFFSCDICSSIHSKHGRSPPTPLSLFPIWTPPLNVSLDGRRSIITPLLPQKVAKSKKKEESESRFLLARKFSSLTIKMPLACLLAASSFKRQKKEKDGEKTFQMDNGRRSWRKLVAFPFHFPSFLNFKGIDTCFCATFINPIAVISTDRAAMGRKRRRANGGVPTLLLPRLRDRDKNQTKTRRVSLVLTPSVGQQAETN